MEFDEMLISTGVDALIKLVKEKGKIEITLASRLLNIPISTIEEWSHALEAEGIISIEYQLTKVYLKWTSPAEEEVEAERTALVEEKSKLTEQVTTLDKKSSEQVAAVAALKDDFNANYVKLMAKLDEAEKKNSGMKQAKEFHEEDYYKSVDELEAVRGQISQVGDSIAFMRSQLEKTREQLSGGDMEKKFQNISGARERAAALKKDLESMETEASKMVEMLSARRLVAANLKESMDSMKKEFEDLNARIERERDVISEMKSVSQVLAGAKKETSELLSSTEEALAELKNAKGTLPEIERRVASVSGRIKENEAKAAQIVESIKNAEETFTNINVGDGGSERLEGLIAEAKDIESRMDKFQGAAEEALSLFENVDKMVSTLSELRKKVGEERKRLAEESGAIFSALDEEIATYSTFQKIKEKATTTINDYLQQLEKITVSYENAAQSAERTEKKLDEAFSKFREGGDYKGAEALSETMDRLAEKRKLLEQIKQGIDSLDAAATRASRQVKLLAKESELISLRSGGAQQARAGGTVQKASDSEIRESIALTESEQREFDLKRDELRKLIKKLWEEE